MKRKVSEFAYGFVLTHELVAAQGYLRVAESPATEEGEGFGHPLFLQFKASDYMKRRNAGESKLVGLPYFRFGIHRLTQSNQQSLLMALEKRGNLVFYATPKIHEAVNLNSAFFDGEIVSGSLFVPPVEIGELPDNEYYRVVFSARSEAVYLCPGGRRLEGVVPGDRFGELIAERIAGVEPRRLDDEFYLSLAREMLTLVSPNRRIFDELSRGRMTMTAATFADYLAKTLFDCELLIVPATSGSRDGVAGNGRNEVLDGEAPLTAASEGGQEL